MLSLLMSRKSRSASSVSCSFFRCAIRKLLAAAGRSVSVSITEYDRRLSP